MPDPVPQGGAPAPELETSPIIDQLEAYDEAAPDVEPEVGVCYFNGVVDPLDGFERSGSASSRSTRFRRRPERGHDEFGMEDDSCRSVMSVRET